MKQKVLILHLAHWQQLLGGAELQLKYLSEYLLSKGHEVHFVFPNRNNKVVAPNGVVQHPLKYTKIPGTFGKTWFSYKNRLETIIKKINPDVLITRTNSSWAGITANYGLQNNIKHVHFVASDKDVQLLQLKIPFTKPFNAIEKKWTKKLYEGNTAFIVQNKFQQEQLLQQFKLTSTLLSQGTPISDVSLIQKETSPIRIIWIANFKEIKRPEKFIALADAFKTNTNVLFEMVGGYTEATYANMLDKVKDNQNFIYHGKCSNEKVNTLLNKAHILVNTSDFEGFSNTFVQAWMRKVVVISMNSNPGNILTTQQIGFCTQNISNTIKQIELLVSMPEQIKTLGEKARSYALQHHAIDDAYYKKIGI